VSARRRRVTLISMGGTIATTPGEVEGDDRPRFGAADLIAGTPGLSEIAEMTATDAAMVNSAAVTVQSLAELAATIRAAAEAGQEGVVITQGTNTIEETAYALALMVEPAIPVVLTGAMRRALDPGADGPANLLAAIRVAATPAAAGLGPVVVHQDEIHLARWVTKAHTARVAPFASPGFGPIGAVHEGRVHLWALPAGGEYLASPAELDLRVELIWAVLGSDGTMARAAVEAGAAGLVVAGLGGGHVPPAMAEALGEIVAGGLPVVLGSRTGAGPVLRDTYSGPGADRELRALGLISAGTLAPVKARLRLLVALAAGVDAQAAFESAPGGSG
jgi:L-asparaginase